MQRAMAKAVSVPPLHDYNERIPSALRLLGRGVSTAEKKVFLELACCCLHRIYQACAEPCMP